LKKKDVKPLFTLKFELYPTSRLLSRVFEKKIKIKRFDASDIGTFPAVGLKRIPRDTHERCFSRAVGARETEHTAADI